MRECGFKLCQHVFVDLYFKFEQVSVQCRFVHKEGVVVHIYGDVIAVKINSQRHAVSERFFFYRRQFLISVEGDACQQRAFAESAFANRFSVCGQDYRCQVLAIVKRFSSYRREVGIGGVERRYGRAFECVFADGGESGIGRVYCF